VDKSDFVAIWDGLCGRKLIASRFCLPMGIVFADVPAASENKNPLRFYVSMASLFITEV